MINKVVPLEPKQLLQTSSMTLCCEVRITAATSHMGEDHDLARAEHLKQPNPFHYWKYFLEISVV